jgi:homeobox protein cut-like
LLRKLDAARFDKDSERHTWEAKLLQSERTASKAGSSSTETGPDACDAA